MSKYKVGDKVILTVTDTIKSVYNPYYMLNDNFILLEPSTDKYAEPLSTYTEPLETKIENLKKKLKRWVEKCTNQSAEITRLLKENERLKAEYEKMSAKIDAYELYGDQHEEEYNQTFNQGAETAWELVRKIFDMETNDIEDIFIKEDAWNLGTVLNNYTYQEAAAKVAEWEKAKKEIKIGDILEYIYDSNVKCVATNLYPSNMAYLVFEDGTAGMHKLDTFKKTGRYIDIDSFLKQIRGEQE